MIEGNEAAQLRDWVDRQATALGDSWVAQLEDRKREEAQFHDEYRLGHANETHGTSSNHRYYEAASVVSDYTDSWLRRMARVAPATFLDFACGDGTQTIKAAKAGAELAIGIDISQTSIENASENAAAAGVSRQTRFLQRDCENTQLPPDSFSACLCSGMLHHLDLSRAFPELARVMRPGGRILCVEALGYNPVIQLYRNRTPNLRTEWEKKHILTMRELKFARRWFGVENVRFFLMASPLATLLPEGPIRRGFLTAGHALDALLTRIPGVQLLSWQFAFELVKPA
ncbi:MAG: class I SAM-dependent methyltransferase [Gemmatimonadaceae bacterium]